MKTRTDIILVVLNVLAWVTFFGLLVKTGSILISYGVSINHPIASENLYMGWNLSKVRQYDFWQYTVIVIMNVAVLILDSYIAYLITRALSKIKMSNPFTLEVSRLLEKISYLILLVWVVAMLYNGHIGWLSKQIAGFQETKFSGEFILMAGVVFVFSQIFKKGVEIQSENELTV
jgi:Protein of unknown function (DUF2975)